MTGPQVTDQQGGDEIAGDDKEHIDPDKATTGKAQARVEQDNGNNGDGAQPVDFGSVFQGHESGRACEM